MTKRIKGRPKKFRPEMNMVHIRHAKARINDAKRKEIQEGPAQPTPVISPITNLQNVESPQSARAESEKRNYCKRIIKEMNMLTATSRPKRIFKPNHDTEEHITDTPGGNRILPIDSMIRNIESHLTCKRCAGQACDNILEDFITFCGNDSRIENLPNLLERFKNKKRKKVSIIVKEQSVGIATKMICSCSYCGHIFETERSRSCFSNNKHQYHSSESFTMNVMLVLGIQQIGGGGSDAMKILTFLGLPNAQSVKDRTFKRIEDAISPVILEYEEEIKEKALFEEVRLTLIDQNRENDYDKWLTNDQSIGRPAITIAYDMGWNKRSNGHRYDSISGHGIGVGQVTNKVVATKLYSKACVVCDSKKYKGADAPSIPNHGWCPKNHDGSSKAMESKGIFDLFVDLWRNKNIAIGEIVSDDDSSMRSQLRHSYKELVNAGRLSSDDWPLTAGGKKNQKMENLILP